MLGFPEKVTSSTGQRIRVNGGSSLEYRKRFYNPSLATPGDVMDAYNGCGNAECDERAPSIAALLIEWSAVRPNLPDDAAGIARLVLEKACQCPRPESLPSPVSDNVI